MDKEQPALGAVFLSASIPDPRLDPVYSAGLDVIGIREATCALAEVVLPLGGLTFGGHPAISPLVATIAQALHRLDAVTVHQSEFFRNVIPSSTLAFQRITWTPETPNDRDQSLQRMRERMLDPQQGAPRFSAAFFIGGMEGVEREFELFTSYQPNAALWPIASTGAAAGILFHKFNRQILSQPAVARLGSTVAQSLLSTTATYRSAFRALLGIP